jgi:quercetin dioxygenase-like cupin family protein
MLRPFAALIPSGEEIAMKNPFLCVCLISLGFNFSALAEERAPDSVEIHPDVHHVLLENEHVRVFRALAAAGDTSPMHSHPPFVLISLGQARLRLTMPDGESVIFDLLPGDVRWLGDGLEHSWEVLSGEVHVVAVEVKSAVE